MTEIAGKVIKMGDHVNTDYIISGKYKFKTQDMTILAKHAFEDLDPNLVVRIKPGDVIAAGLNFGCGSSREHAPRVIKAVGISAVLAKSFARIFFRNCINVGLPAITLSDSFLDNAREGDIVNINLDVGLVQNRTNGMTEKFSRLPSSLMDVLLEGGVVSYVNKHGALPWEDQSESCSGIR
jgi:3-isopropylmalate/(R)-2-methylmalate dehydratase small subunit